MSEHEPIIYIDHSGVRARKLYELKIAIGDLSDFVKIINLELLLIEYEPIETRRMPPTPIWNYA
jgi:hypothetical protein